MDVISIALANQKFDNMSGVNCVYVSKKGNDANDGSIGSPKLTIQAAITKAATKINTNNPQVTVVVLDSGRYQENITLQDNIHLFAEKATIVGRINIRNNCKVSIYAHYASENNQTMLYKDGTAHAYYRTVISDGRGLSGAITGTSNIYNITASSILFTEVELMFVAVNGIGVRELSSTTGHIHFLIKDLYLSGNNARGIYAQGTASNLIGKVDHILETGTPSNTTAIQVNNADCIVKVTVEEITADIAYNIAAGSLYLNCPKITGSVIGTPKFLPASKSDVEEQKIKIAKVEKELGDYQKTISQININMEAKQKVSGYGVVSLPKTSANGQVSISVKGNTEVDEEGNTKSTVSASRLKSVGKNLFDGKVYGNMSDGGIVDGREVYKLKHGTDQFWNFKGKLNTQYTVSFDYKKDSGSAGSTQVEFVYSDGTKSVAQALNTTNWAKVIATSNSGKTLVGLKQTYVNTGTTYFDKNTFMLNEGTTSLLYEPYTESTQYIQAKDSEGKIVELRSLPNGTKDEVNVAERKAIFRTNEKVLEASDIYIIENKTNTQYVYIKKPVDFMHYNKTESAGNSAFSLSGYQNYSSGNIDSTAQHNKVTSTGSAAYFILVVPLNTYNSASEAKTALAGLTLTYQLSESIEVPIQVSGTLLGYPSGTIYVEPVVADAGVYTDKMNILYEDLPIDYIEKLSKIDFATGLETELNPNQCVVAGDKKSFIHPNLESGDIVFFTYAYNREGTQGECEVEYYDSRYVIKDSVTDKFYKWNISIADGVPSISVVEV